MAARVIKCVVLPDDNMVPPDDEDEDIESDDSEIPEPDKDEPRKDCVEYIKKPNIIDLKCGRGGD